jgi:hypothetical protein
MLTFDARTRGDLATEISPLAQNEFRKKKRTIYRKSSHEVLAFVSWRFS